MTDEVISPLRRRMIEDMTIRKLAPKTQQGYIHTIKGLAAFIGRSPDKPLNRQRIGEALQDDPIELRRGTGRHDLSPMHGSWF
jgi:hypothetical protein